MSRSKHTDPKVLRAIRRLREPFQTRSAGDRRFRRRSAQGLKELGVTVESNRKAKCPQKLQLRILIQEPGPGFYHPASSKDILAVFREVGPLALYGLRAVELVRLPVASGSLNFGRYEAPGRIILFAQPVKPRRLQGLLKPDVVQYLEGAGAVVRLHPGAESTLVNWPRQALRRFMLEEVLLHELGHHLLQHHKGKRSQRVARTRDHESFAARFARKQQAKRQRAANGMQ